MTDNEIIKVNEREAYLFRKIHERDSEIERLKNENESLRMAGNSLKMHYNTARAEAIKEFAERMKNRLENGPFWDWSYEYITMFNDIEEVEKEMTEEQK